MDVRMRVEMKCLGGFPDKSQFKKYLSKVIDIQFFRRMSKPQEYAQS